MVQKIKIWKVGRWKNIFFYKECVFHLCFMLIGSWRRKQIQGKNLLGSGYKKTKDFFQA